MIPNRILILRFSSIGDIVLTTAMIEYLKKMMPDCELHFLTRSDYAAILDGNPNLARIVMVERTASLTSLRHLARKLTDFRYSLFLDLHDSLRTKYLRWWLRDYHWIIYRKPRLNRFFLFYLHYNRFSQDHDITSNYFRLLNNQVHDNFRSRPTIHIRPQEKERSLQLLGKYGVDGKFVGVIPGAAWYSKIWLANRYIKVLNTIYEEEKLPIVILGGWKDSICDILTRGVPHAINLKGKTDLRTSLAILSCAEVVIGSDTGLTHGAEAVGTPVILINGPTSREVGARVRAKRSAELTARPWCQPCSKNGSRPCYRKEQVCLTEITPDLVLTSLRNVLTED